jgi:ABC-2 type transport system permease protein
MMSLQQISVASQVRAIGAVTKREWRIFVRYPSWFISLLVWPVLFPIGYIFMAKALGGPGGTDLAQFQQLAGTSNYMGFIVIGTIVWMWLNMTLWDTGLILRNEQLQGTLESNWLCPIWRINLLFGAGLFKQLALLLFLVISAIELELFYGVPFSQSNLLLLVTVVLVTLPSLYGVGLAFASLVMFFKEAESMVLLVRGLVMIFCGISFPLAILPGWMQSIGGAIPFSYTIRLLRAIVLEQANFAQISSDLKRLLAFGIILPIIGYILFWFTERHARTTGDLGRY